MDDDSGPDPVLRSPYTVHLMGKYFFCGHFCIEWTHGDESVYGGYFPSTEFVVIIVLASRTAACDDDSRAESFTTNWLKTPCV